MRVTPLPDLETLALRSGPFSALVAPAAGGRMTALRHAVHGDILRPLQQGWDDPMVWPKAGAFPLVPFHNRMHGGGFVWEGRRIDLRPRTVPGGQIMHGQAQLRPWSVSESEADRVHLMLDYQADPDWPFDFRTEQRFRLTEDGLEIGMSITNTGRAAMPAGLGWHPYFNAPAGAPVHCDAARLWSVPPDQPWELAASDVARDDAGALVPVGVTDHFSQWSAARVRLVSGIWLTLAASPSLRGISVHRTEAYTCLEPVSHIAGAFAAMPDTPEGTGPDILGPDQSLNAQIHLGLAA